MPVPNCPLCGAPLPLVLDATTGRCPNCKFDFGRMLDVFQQFGPKQASSATLKGDSLDTVETVMQLEEHFDINVPQEELENVDTIEEAIRLLEKYRRRPPETN